MAAPIRVLQVVMQMNRGGLESRLMDIYREIDKSKVQFDFYTFRLEKGIFDDEIKSMGGKIYYNKPIQYSFLKVSYNFSEFLRNHLEYKIVHAHVNQWCGIILHGAEDAEVPIRIAHSRTAEQTKHIKNFFKNIVKLSTNKYSTYKFAVSKEAGEWLFGEKAINNNLVKVWPNAIDVCKFKFNNEIRKKMRKNLGLNGKFVIIHVGRFDVAKNHDFLIDVFSEVYKKNNKSVLMLVGKGLLEQRIKEKVSNLGLNDAVLFMGLRDDVYNLLQAADIFVFPSWYEGLPGTVLEAQASGLKCVISDVITNEVNIASLVDWMSLKVLAKVWADKILEYKNGYERKDMTSFFMKSGFDINSLSNKLTDFYIKEINKIE